MSSATVERHRAVPPHGHNARAFGEEREPEHRRSPHPWQWRHERSGDDVNGAAIARCSDAPRFTSGTMSYGTKSSLVQVKPQGHPPRGIRFSATLTGLADPFAPPAPESGPRPAGVQ
jgi:hypothetical protein